VASVALPVCVERLPRFAVAAGARVLLSTVILKHFFSPAVSKKIFSPSIKMKLYILNNLAIPMSILWLAKKVGRTITIN
jgi:hypothetical protein